jgi:lysophospholipase L1-like esterase
MSFSWFKGRVTFRVFLIGFSLLVLVFFWCSLLVIRFFYKRELLLREQRTSHRPATKSGNPVGIRILFLGDSRASQWTSLPGDRYLTMNAGGSGETTQQIRQRTASLLESEKPQIVVFQGGINDLKMIGVLPAKQQELESRCLENIDAIVKFCRESGIRVVLTPIIPPGRISLARRIVWSARIESSVGRINSALKEHYGRQTGVIVLDIEQSLGFSRLEPLRVDLKNYRDELHLTPEAYVKIQPDLVRCLDLLSAK